MATYNSVFKRVEKKYRLSAAERSALEVTALERMGVDSYGRSLVTSLYLDTPQRDMIARSVEKPLYKEKLRLRVYGEPEAQALMHAFCSQPVSRNATAPLSDAQVMLRCERACAGTELVPASISVFFEIKKKHKGVVYKRRLALSLPAALAFFSGLSFEQAVLRWPLAKADGSASSPSKQERQIARELAATMDRWAPLVPSMGIACYREAWALKDDMRDEAFDPQLRVTFDDHLRFCDCLAPQPVWTDLIASSEAIMEIKSAGPYPLWLARALSREHAYPASFTKYGTAYETVCKKGASSCSTRPSLRSSAALTR